MVFIEFFIGHKITGKQLYGLDYDTRVRVDGVPGRIERRRKDAGGYTVVALRNRQHEVVGMNSQKKLRRRGIFY